MNTGEKPEAEFQDRQILLIVGALATGLLCCCTLGLASYVALVISMNPLLLNPAARETATAVALQEVNSASPLGTFYFGLGDANAACRIPTQSDEISQEDLLRHEYISFSAPFGDEHEGETIDWSVHDLHGKLVESGINQTLTLSDEENHCVDLPLFLSPRTEPGDYVLEVNYEGELAYREVFSITYSDLTKIPRPTRKPFGDFTFGHEGIDTTTCTTNAQASTYSLAELKENPWFYFASPFQFGDIDTKIYWEVHGPNGESIFDEQGVVDDDIDLCFWQGFSMEDSDPGKYTLVIEDAQSVTLYKTDFELK